MKSLRHKLINKLFEEKESEKEELITDEKVEECDDPSPEVTGPAKSTISAESREFIFKDYVKSVIKEHGWYDEEKGYETMADMKFGDALDMEEFESTHLSPEASEEEIHLAELEDDYYLGKADAAMGNIDSMLYRDNESYRRGADGIPL